MSKLTDLQSCISIRILELRVEKGWSQQKLADILGTSRAQIYRLEDPLQCKPSIDTLINIARVYRKDLIIELGDRD